MNLELKKSVAAVETLKTRYSALDQEAQLYSGQLIAVERLRKSGASEEILTREVEAMQNRTAESKRAIDAEKALATASADTLSKMSQQADEAQSIASSLASLQTSVGKRVMDAQSPEVRRDASRQNLRTVLDGEGAGSLEDLRKKVGGSTNDGDKAKALNALSKGLDILEEIRRANQEIAAAEEARTSASIAGSERERAETDKTREAKERLAEVESDQGRAREEFAASITALKAEAAGRNDLAESLRSEIALRSEAVTLSKQLGISEEEMIKKLRDRASIAERIKAQSGGLGAGKGTSGRRSNIGIDENPPGNNLQDWKWRLQRGMPRIESPSFKRVAPLQSNSLRDGELQRRSNQRSMTRARADHSAKFLAELVQVAREGNEMWRNMGMV